MSWVELCPNPCSSECDLILKWSLRRYYQGTISHSFPQEDWCPCKKRSQRPRGLVVTGRRRLGWCCCEARGLLGRSKASTARKGAPPSGLEGTGPCWHNKFLLFKPPSLWHLVMEAQETNIPCLANFLQLWVNLTQVWMSSLFLYTPIWHGIVIVVIKETQTF